MRHVTISLAALMAASIALVGCTHTIERIHDNGGNGGGGGTGGGGTGGGGGGGGGDQCLNGTNAPANYSTALSITGYFTATPGWSSEAVVQSLAQYFGGNAPQCETASVYGALSSGYCCIAGNEQSPQCNQYGEPEDILADYFGVESLWYNGTVLPGRFITELDNGRPVIIMYNGPFPRWIIVYSTRVSGASRVFGVLDPYSGRSEQTYAQLLSGRGDGGYQWNWVRTVYHLTDGTLTCP